MTTHKLTTPISEDDIRRLKVNDVLYVSGTIVTARDQAHKRALQLHKEGKQLPIDLEGLAVFHCGPIVKKEGDRWSVVAAGPTTSTRMDIFEDEFIDKFKARVIIGKGGMGEKTLDACKQVGGAYLHAIGGAASLIAKSVVKVLDVYKLEFGVPEAMWVIEVKDFPVVVTMDSHLGSLHQEISDKSKIALGQLLSSI